MPDSIARYRKEIREWVLAYYLPENDLILDVGPGKGNYATLLPEYKMDAVEIYRPYVDKFGLNEKYQNVFVQPVQGFVFIKGKYQLTIWGDVIEHLSVVEAQETLSRCLIAGSDALIVVPYMYAQGAYGGVESERHLQPDLTKERMVERYPQLSFLFGDTAPQAGSIAIWWAKGEPLPI